ncbi:MAG: hypothetical protein Q9212_006255 [Teloschistes hypoglaucus]
MVSPIASAAKATSGSFDFLYASVTPSGSTYKGYHHMTWYVGNAKQAASYYITRFGFRLIAYQGLETGSRCIASQVISNGGATLVFKAPLRKLDSLLDDVSDDEQSLLTKLHVHLSEHGDAVKDVAFEVDDAKGGYWHAIKQGAFGEQRPLVMNDELGTVTTATIRMYGDTTHTLIESGRYRGVFMPGYRPVQAIDPIERYLPHVSFEAIDHCVGNQDWDKMQEVCDYYERTLSFHRFWTVDDTLLSQSYSTVMASPPPSLIKIPINEPAAGLRRSQIEEFVNFNNGAGVQHIAFRCTNIVSTVQNLRDRGVDFIEVPSAYYEGLRQRLVSEGDRNEEKRKWQLKEDLAEIERLKILIDFDEGGYLLQIFTKPVLDRPTVFMEIIQRENFDGFGAGNFKALFEAVAMEQGRRGNL